MKSKLLRYLIIGIIATSCSWEATQKSKDMIQEIQESYSEMIKLLPEAGSEVEFAPEIKVDSIGFLDDRDAYQVFYCEETQFRAIADGTYNENQLDSSGQTWLSDGSWYCFDPKPFTFRKGYSNEIHESDITKIAGAHHIGIFRTSEKYYGKWEGDVILEQAWYKGWFFLINVPQRKIVGCINLEITGGDEAWDWAGDGMDPLEEDLRGHVISKANDVVNQWAGTENWRYFDIFYPEELK